MKKFVFIVNALEIIAGLLRGERYEGVLFWDSEAGRITFKAWNRKAPKYYKQKKICDLDGGWLGAFGKVLFVGVVSTVVSFGFTWLVRLIPGVKKVI